MSKDYRRMEELQKRLDDNHAETTEVITQMFALHPTSSEQKQELKHRHDSLVNHARELHDSLAKEFEKG